jgi:hypothetical protein
MDSVESSPQPHQAKKKAPGGKQPLYIRLYFRRHMTELVQLIGYREVSLDEMRKQLVPLVEQYGQETITDATDEIVEIIEVARLKQEVRRVARQILGPPPNPAGATITNTSLPTPTPSSAIANDQTEHSMPSDTQNMPPQNEPPLSAVEEPPASTEEERYLAAYEAHEGPLYCCDQPKLQWSGEIDNLSVACESCGYVLFARDELMPDGEPPGIILDAEESQDAGIPVD